mmetsp:Transcript_42709/g.103300  ORF Transcript_42709/g.103300 Transcript_42709/m.103300 type:complete len:701 (+) Transcript_42709:81-2183(+)
MESQRSSKIQMMTPIRWIIFFAFLILRVDGFYVPGVQPQSFVQGDLVKLSVNSLTSIHTQVSTGYYHLPFCLPDGGYKLIHQNLGEYLTGNRIESSPYQLQMKVDTHSKILCSTRIDNAGYEVLSTHIRYDYHNNWIVDNLPSASVGVNQQMHFAGGFPIGFLDPMWKKPYIYNHVNIYLDYHEIPVAPGRYHIVGFAVEPMSVKHDVGNETERNGSNQKTPKTSIPGQHMDRNHILENQKVVVGETITFTYDVIWKPSNVAWASRWDIYLSEDNLVPDEVHWYPIVNAILFALFLAAMITTVLVQHLRKDTAEASMSIPLLVDSNNTDSCRDFEDEECGETASDVQQSYPMLLSVCVGSGAQLFLCSLLVTILSALGLLNPSGRGHLVQCFLLLYIFSGILNGYISSRMYKAFGGKQKNLCTLASAFGVSGISFLLLLILNIISVLYRSVATPISIVAVLAVMWCLSVVMVFVGAHIGLKKEAMNIPSISRVDAKGKHPPPLLNMLPSKVVSLLIFAAMLIIALILSEAWMDYIIGLALIAIVMLISICTTLGRLPRWFRVMSAGVLPFVVIYVELFFIMTNMWMNQYYYVFEYTLMVYIALVVVVAEVTVLLVYNELCSGTSRVWWLSFLAGASPGLYTFMYSIFWFRNLEPADMIITYATFLGGMSILCGAIMLVTGSVAFVAALCFVRMIVGVQTE